MKSAVRRKLKLLDMALLRDTKTCIFCGSPNVTKEHVFSKRFHKYMDPPKIGRAKGVITVMRAKKSEQVRFKMPGPMRDWQIKCVCGGDVSTCNNGWMRELDESMDSIGGRLMRTPVGCRLPFRLSDRDQSIIATWAIMKAMVIHHGIITKTQRKNLKAKLSPPKGWGVWIGRYVRNGGWDPEFSTQPFALVRDRFLNGPSRKTKANSHATTMVFHNLFVHVVYLREHSFVAQWKFPRPFSGPIMGHLFRIWPALGHSILWPGTTLTDREAAFFSEVLYRVYHKTIVKLGLMPNDTPITEL